MALLIAAATRNPDKAKRIRALLDGLDVAVADGAALTAAPDPPEDDQSHLAIATAKAAAWSRALGGLVVASDGGLVIPALGDGWSSLITRRGTGADVSDEERGARLLRRMRGLDGERRACRWTEAVAVAREGELLGAWEASGLDGAIALDYVPPPGGTNGFWVSALWVTRQGVRRWALSPGEERALGDPWAALRAPVRALVANLAAGESGA